MINKQKIEDILKKRVSEIIVEEDLREKLFSGKRLRVYFGVDPTSSLLHLGHAVVLRKLQEFCDLGHEVILLIGDFTAKIGDPTGKDVMRAPLATKQIKEHFKDYKKQASKVLNFSKVKIKYNSKWLSKLKFEDIIKFSSHFTVQQMLHRDMFDKRMKEGMPINQIEFMYPLMQGYDSVAMNVDVEIGGNDQMFNMLVGRTLQKAYNNKSKDVLTMKLLVGTDGRKMSKTYSNAIYLTDSPGDMFGKIMSIKDELISEYFELCTDLAEEEIMEIKKIPNPRDQKVKLAKEIVTIYHGLKAAQKAQEEFNAIFRNHEIPDNIEIFETSLKEYLLLDLLFDTKLVSSKNEAKRLIEGGGVSIRMMSDELRIRDWREKIEMKDGMVLQVGKRKFVKINLKS